MAKIKDITGQRFGRLTAIRRTGKDANRASIWLFQCDCGTELEIQSNSAVQGRTVSCGCYNAELRLLRNTTHGQSNTRVYKIWIGMIQRCTNTKNPAYKDYGGRGIAVCDRWLHSFDNFYADMGDCPDGLSLDRFPDNNGNYEPGNVRWATQEEQTRNQRSNIVGTINGEEVILKDAVRRYGSVSYDTAKSRIRRGWSFYAAVTQRVRI